MTRHVYHCPMRWSDIDAYGHVNNAAYVTYLEQARLDAFHTRLGVEAGARGLSQGVFVVEHQLRYRRPVAFQQRALRIELWATAVRAASYVCQYEIWDEDQPEPVLATTARSTLAAVELTTGRPRRFSAAERAFLEGFGDDHRDDGGQPGVDGRGRVGRLATR